ncbi:MAG TPA: hypothetical protein VN634_04590 [Candidatus Limnocylindrales bacterium]|nr:hypothetical protein [Candidatus Limnocylindrales bacterium]
MVTTRVSLFTLSVVAPAVLASTSYAFTNSYFDQDLRGWDLSPAASWSPEDSDGSEISGSVQFELDSVTTAAISQCIAVDGGDTYEYGVDVLLDIPNNAGGRAGLVVVWTSDAGCENELPGIPPSTSATSATQWKLTGGSATSPLDAVAARIELRATKTGGGPSAKITANLDDPFFYPIGISPAGQCADPAEPFHLVTVADALFVLRTAVAIQSCDPCRCDADGVNGATTNDALSVLRYAVGNEVTLNCPACS